MKTIPTIALVLISGLASLSAGETKQPKEVAALLADYNKELTKAKESSDKILRSEGSKIVGKLVRDARAEEAKLVGAQVEDKLAGKAVTGVHSGLTKLFELYDGAVTTAARPIREKYCKRVDTLIINFEGKDMSAILALSDAKKEIEGTADTPLNTEQTPADLPKPQRATLDGILGTWSWNSGDKSDQNSIQFEKDGTGSHGSRGNTTWEVNGNRDVTITHPTKGKAVIHLKPDAKSFSGTGYDGKPVTGQRIN